MSAGILHGREDLRAFPADIGKDVRQHRFAFLLVRRAFGGQVLVTKNEEKERLVVAHGESGNLSSRNPVAEIDEFVARPIALDLERGDVITERHFDPRVGPEHKLADARMQPVRADDQIGLTRGSMIEADPHAVPLLLDPRDGVAEDRLDRSIQRTVDRRRKVGAPQGREAAVGQAAEDVRREAAALAAVPVHEAHLPHLVTQLSDSGDQAHLFGDVVADPQKSMT